MTHKSVHREVESGPHTIWIDNFSKVHGAKIPSIDIGAWRNCLWTGTAIRKYTGDRVIDMSVQLDGAGEVVPAMPDDLFANEADFNAVFDRCVLDTTYYDTSLTTLYRVNSVPLKPDACRVDNHNYRRALQGDTDRLRSMYPKEIAAVNIGSNLGLARIMRAHYDENNQGPGNRCTKYSALNVDENIFMRVLKVHTRDQLHEREQKVAMNTVMTTETLAGSAHRRHPPPKKTSIYNQ